MWSGSTMPQGIPRRRFQQVRAQRRLQRKGRERGHENGRDHRDGELPVNSADTAGEKRHRYEHGGQHGGNTDDRAAHLLHRPARGRTWRETLFAHHAIDVLDHDNGIVDQDPDRQHHREHGEHVDRHAEHIKREQRAGQRNRNDHGGYQRITQVAQEQPHDQEHQQHGFEQRQRDFVQRDVDELGTVERNLHGRSRRQATRQLRKLRADRAGGFHRVALRREADTDRRRRFAVQPRKRRVAVPAQLDPRDILQPNGRSIRARFQHDFAEFGRRDQLPPDRDRRRQLLTGDERHVAERAGRDRRVLRRDGLGYIGGGEIEFAQFHGIDPDPQRLSRIPQFG